MSRIFTQMAKKGSDNLKQLLILGFIAFGLGFLASCDSSATALNTGTKESITASVYPAITTLATQTPTPIFTATPFKEPLMTDNLTELFVGQMSKDGSGSIGDAPYNNDHTGLHTQSLHLAYYEEKLYLFFSFKKHSQEVLDGLLKQIKVSTGIQYEINPTQTLTPNEVRYKMDIADFDSAKTMTIQFGNTPEIFIFKTEPMQISLADTDSDTANLFFKSSGLHMGLNFLAANNQTISFVFSEPIDQAVSSVQPDIGEWTDKTHYKVKLIADLFMDSPRMIFNVKSVRGNRLREVDSYLNVRFFKEKSWFDASTKQEILGGPRLHFYDNFIYSPDKISYIANVFLEGPFGDEGGGYYGLVLEQPKKPAIILETV